MESHQPADVRAEPGHIACRVTVADGADVVSRQSSDETNAPARIAYIARRVAVDEAAEIGSDESANVAASADIASGVTAGDGACARPRQIADVIHPDYSAADNSHIFQHARAAKITKQPDVRLWQSRDREAGDGMPQAIERPCEPVGCVANRRKAGASLPAAGQGGIDGRSQCEATGQRVLDPLQGGAGGIACHTQTVDHGVGVARDRETGREPGQRDAGAVVE